ncbi:glycosyltransferase [Ralstonia insidiosa]|uniref:Glycosyltransferase family 4 protein n=1 Tax=Ralstonia insidiosa TaxID=190721 RepID=A0A848PED6_9RALS|nr:glycosyltransferase [Ralstonia insidiosa]NMV41888.1 glycosyltransferase family 4 protein [Ralstonia insidiosa]
MIGEKGARRLLVSAFGIHMGGGLVLLRALLDGAGTHIREILIDARIGDMAAGGVDGPRRVAVARSFWSRVASLYFLARRARADDILFSFNSLPPLVRSKAFVVNYVHAPHFIGAHAGIKYAPLTRIRLTVERFWFACGVRHCDEIWVQTPTMAQALLEAHPRCKVRVVPLVDVALFAGLSVSTPHSPKDDGSQFTFYYPADGVGHKNHTTLLRAWQYLAKEGLTPKLQLTLRPDELARAAKAAGVTLEAMHGIENLGRMSREEVLDGICRCSALIFPSLAETFGLPLLEARMLGTPIVASERDFVRDVCSPRETFDPESARSVADAVRRFITGRGGVISNFYSAPRLVDELLLCAERSSAEASV